MLAGTVCSVARGNSNPKQARHGTYLALSLHEVRQGVLIVSTGAWFDPDPSGASGLSCHHGNPNVLTPDLGTSKLAQGPAAHSCLVEVEKWTGGAVAMTAHKPPLIEDGRHQNLKAKA